MSEPATIVIPQGVTWEALCRIAAHSTDLLNFLCDPCTAILYSACRERRQNATAEDKKWHSLRRKANAELNDLQQRARSAA